MDGDLVGEQRDAAARLAVEADDVAGLEGEDVLDGQVGVGRPRRARDLDAAQRGVDRLAVSSSSPAGPAPSRCEKAAETGEMAQNGTSSDSVEEVRAMRASMVSERVGSLNGATCAFSVVRLERAERELDLGDVLPDQRELAEHRAEEAARQRQSISVRRRSFGA